MKLTTTRNLIVTNKPSPDLLSRFDQVYPNIDPNQEVSLLDILNNDINTLGDVVWCLRATVQDSKQVSVEFAKQCACRAIRATALTYMSYAVRSAARTHISRAASAANHIAAAAYAAYVAAAAYVDAVAADAELNKQKQDLIELLS
jgi:hypothetical protein